MKSEKAKTQWYKKCKYIHSGMWYSIKASVAKPKSDLQKLILNDETNVDLANWLNKPLNHVFSSSTSSNWITKVSLDTPIPLCNERDILNNVCSLTTRKAQSNDNIPSIFLKLVANSLLLPLCYIFNEYLLQNVFPDSWKPSYNIPIPQSNPVRQTSSQITLTFH